MTETTLGPDTNPSPNRGRKLDSRFFPVVYSIGGNHVAQIRGEPKRFFRWSLLTGMVTVLALFGRRRVVMNRSARGERAKTWLAVALAVGGILVTSPSAPDS